MKTIYRYTNIMSALNVDDAYQLQSNEIEVTTEVNQQIADCVKPAIINNQVVETATPEEIAEFEMQKEIERIKADRDKKRADGIAYYEEIDIKMHMQFAGRPAEEINPLVAETDKLVVPVMNLVKDGQWYSALMLAYETPNPTYQEVLDGFNEIKEYIATYVAENYTTE